MKLRDLQRSFMDALIGGDCDRRLLAAVCDDGAMTADERIAVHRNNMRYSLSRTLQQIYPVCYRILGKGYFRQVAQTYIGRHPSDQNDLNDYGGYLAGFFAELAAKRDELSDFMYLPDLARMEWHFHMAYYAADDPPFDFGAFEKTARQNGGQVYFLLSASLALLASAYPLLEIWQTNQSEATATTVAREGNEYLCIFRRDDEPRIERIDQPRYDLLRAIAGGASLEQLAERSDMLDSELPTLIREGWVCGFTTSKPARRTTAG